ncbi:MAG: hypothetical protein HQM09_00225 [Candidatus Riflebacteria bacterium]|nr:hypothetical protein [Candidatus Riflebacteria bacterium]
MMSASKQGFSLIEILLSLMILSGTVVSLVSGIGSAESLDRHTRFEYEATTLAERELEILKSDLLSGKRSPGPRGGPGRFRLHPGWTSRIAWAAPDADGAVRLASEIIHGSDRVRLESFLYVPASVH